jgi:hypothetical protein
LAITLSKADRQAIINSIVIFIRMGLDPYVNKKYIIAFLKRNNVIKNISVNTLTKYIGEARKITKTDFVSNAWMTEKVQDAMIKDYKQIWEQQDEIVANLRNQIHFMVKDAKRVSKQCYEKENRYIEFIDKQEFRMSNMAYNEALTKKMEMMKAGFIQFKIQRYIEALQAKGTSNKTLDDLEKDPIIAAINKSPLVTEPKQLTDKENIEIKQETDGFELAEHLKPFEDKLNKKLSSLERDDIHRVSGSEETK